MKSESRYKCMIWGTPLSFCAFDQFALNEIKEIQPSYKEQPNQNRYRICNPIAGGQYYISKTQMKSTRSSEYTTMGIEDRDQDHRLLTQTEQIRISGFIAQENLNKNIPNLDQIMQSRNWIEAIPEIPNPTNRAYLLLEGLVRYTNFIGRYFKLNTSNSPRNGLESYLYALSYCSKSEEFEYLLNYLEEIQCIKGISKTIGSFGGSVTVKGFEKIYNISNIDSRIAFIAMWITDSKNEYHHIIQNLYQSILRVIEKAGYRGIRIDKKEHNNKIDDEILSDINKSRFIVCDLTSEKEKPRGSVYFEAGYALGKNIPIIWTCDKRLEKEIAFDIRQYNCLFWEENNMDSFERRLQHRIENTIATLK